MSKRAAWLKRLGFLGFCFFFIKGLVWLAIGAAAVVGSCSLVR